MVNNSENSKNNLKGMFSHSFTSQQTVCRANPDKPGETLCEKITSVRNPDGSTTESKENYSYTDNNKGNQRFLSSMMPENPFAAFFGQKPDQTTGFDFPKNDLAFNNFDQLDQLEKNLEQQMNQVESIIGSSLSQPRLINRTQPASPFDVLDALFLDHPSHANMRFQQQQNQNQQNKQTYNQFYGKRSFVASPFFSQGKQYSDSEIHEL